mgnify:CR=1 FL=1
MKDQLNRAIQFKETPKRIISLVPSQTELLCDLGLEGSLVGVTKFCTHPHYIKSNVVVVGGTKQIQLKKLQALQPDIILCNKEENTKAIVESCESICNVHISDIYTFKDNLELITQYGCIFKKEKEALNIIEELRGEISIFNDFIQNKPTFKVAYFIWRKPWMVAGNKTFINHILQLNKFENIYSKEERYPKIELSESHLNNCVEVVFLSSEPYPFNEVHKIELQKFYPNATIVLVDGEMFSWYGSRLRKAFKYFKKLRLNLQKKQLL